MRKIVSAVLTGAAMAAAFAMAIFVATAIIGAEPSRAMMGNSKKDQGGKQSPPATPKTDGGKQKKTPTGSEKPPEPAPAAPKVAPK
jgi:hypothetical protein